MLGKKNVILLILFVLLIRNVFIPLIEFPVSNLLICAV